MNSANWITLAIGLTSALIAGGSAMWAARSAGRARAAEGETERLRRLEQRVAQHKYDVYAPMLELFSRMLDPKKSKLIRPEKFRDDVDGFSRGVSVFGSDEAVRAFRNFMQGTYGSAPAPVLLRLYADFQLAARRDMGDPDTVIGAADLLGIRINDLYTGGRRLYDAMLLPFDEVCAREGWEIPWLRIPDAEIVPSLPVPDPVPSVTV